MTVRVHRVFGHAVVQVLLELVVWKGKLHTVILSAICLEFRPSAQLNVCVCVCVCVSRFHVCGALLMCHTMPSTGIVIWMTLFYITMLSLLFVHEKQLQKVCLCVCVCFTRAWQAFPTGIMCCCLCFSSPF